MSRVENIFEAKRKPIINKWLDLISEAHPAGNNLFKDKDQFTNPVGHTISSEIEILYEELLRDDVCSEKAALSLDKIVRITAIQEYTPSQAIGFLFLLKKAVRDVLGDITREKQISASVLDFYDRIDQLTFTAFNMYASCRERILEIRVTQIRNERDDAFRLMDRMLLKHEELEDALATSYNNDK